MYNFSTEDKEVLKTLAKRRNIYTIIFVVLLIVGGNVRGNSRSRLVFIHGDARSLGSFCGYGNALHKLLPFRKERRQKTGRRHLVDTAVHIRNDNNSRSHGIYMQPYKAARRKGNGTGIL